MKTALLILSLISFLLLGACATRTEKIVDATWVSMKNPMPPGPNDKLVKVKGINEEYCVQGWSGEFGLMDEVVKQAEANYHLDYIKYPSFTKTAGRSCIQMIGEGYRVTN